MILRRTALALAASLALAACTAGGGSEPAGAPGPSATTTVTASPGPPVPGDEWARGDAGAAGFDVAALRRLDRRLSRLGSSCFVVTKDGRLVHETSFGTSDRETMGAAFSVTKSFTSVLVGIAADEGLLSLDDRASEYIPQWKGTASAGVTVRDLLANVSGRHWDFVTDYTRMAIAARDKTAFAISLRQDAPPGTVWRYNNAAIQTLEAVLTKATGEEPAEYARTRLLEPLGMTRTFWGEDATGHTTMFSGINASCLDLARLGLLMLRKGRWGDEQILSSQYVARATDRSSSRLNAAYGLLWWVNKKGPILGALTATGPGPDGKPERPTQGRLAPRAPSDAFWALGLGKQVVAVVPSEGIVAVRMGAAPHGPDALSPDDFTGAVLATLR